MKIVRTKSIRNVDDARLVDSLSQLCAMLHGAAAMRAFDGPRRSMIDNGIKIRPIMAALADRGQTNPNPDCPVCANQWAATVTSGPGGS